MVENILPKKYFLIKINLIGWSDVGMITAISLELELALELEKLKNINMMAKRVINNNYQYPERDKEIIAKISDLNYEVGNYVLPENASVEEKIKYEICQTILTYQQENKVSYKKLTQYLELPFAKTMGILKRRIDNFTLKELVNYLEKLTIPCQVKIIPTQLKSESVPRFKNK